MLNMVADPAGALRATVRVAELVCGLPAVATQDWCDKAAAAMLPIVGAGVCVTLIAQIDEKGLIFRQEATGVAGCAVAEITTSVGRGSTALSTVMLDPNDAALVRVRTNMAQTRELHWPIGPAAYAGPTPTQQPVRAGSPLILLPGHYQAQAQVARRWESIPHTRLLLGAVSLGVDGRALIVELAATGPGAAPPPGEDESPIVEAVLPLLARRAMLAIGTGPAESAHWLTAREQVILQHLLLGKSVREIAEELGRSPHTVHDHVKSLHRKLNASSRGELVARALGYLESKPMGPGPLMPIVPEPSGS